MMRAGLVRANTQNVSHGVIWGNTMSDSVYLLQCLNGWFSQESLSVKIIAMIYECVRPMKAIQPFPQQIIPILREVSASSSCSLVSAKKQHGNRRPVMRYLSALLARDKGQSDKELTSLQPCPHAFADRDGNVLQDELWAETLKHSCNSRIKMPSIFFLRIWINP